MQNDVTFTFGGFGSRQEKPQHGTIETHNYYVWKIPKDFQWNDCNSSKISPYGYPFRFMLKNIRLKTASADAIEIRLQSLSKHTSLPSTLNQVNHLFSCYMKDKNQEKRYCNEEAIEVNHATTAEYTIWSVNRDEFLNSISDFLVGDHLTFVCIAGPAASCEGKNEMVSTAVQTGNYPIPDHVDVPRCLESLSLDLGALLAGNVPTDVELKCGEHSLSAHRIILSARSDVFAAMFKSNMVESHSGCIKIDDISFSVFQEFLHYIYTGKLSDLTVESATQLYEAGDKYAVVPLKKKCAEFLTANLTEQNACSLLFLGDAHADQYLKDYVTAFIVDRRIPQVDDVWLEFSKTQPDLAVQVYRAFVARFCPKIAP